MKNERKSDGPVRCSELLGRHLCNWIVRSFGGLKALNHVDCFTMLRFKALYFRLVFYLHPRILFLKSGYLLTKLWYQCKIICYQLFFDAELFLHSFLLNVDVGMRPNEKAEAQPPDKPNL